MEMKETRCSGAPHVAEGPEGMVSLLPKLQLQTVGLKLVNSLLVCEAKDRGRNIEGNKKCR